MNHDKRLSSASSAHAFDRGTATVPAGAPAAPPPWHDDRYVIVEPPEFDDEYVDAAYEAGIDSGWDSTTEH
jgi:hypothetical protein